MRCFGQEEIEDQEDSCLPASGFVQWRTGCSLPKTDPGAPSPEACAWLPVLDAFWKGDGVEADLRLRDAFDMSAAHAETVSITASMFAPILLESMSCAVGETAGLMATFERVLKRPHLGTPAGLEMLAQLTEMDPRALAALPNRGGEGWESVERAARGFAELVSGSFGSERLKQLLARIPMIGGSPGPYPTLQVWDPVLADLAPHFEAVDRALESTVHGTKPGRRFRLLASTIAAMPSNDVRAMAWVRAGSGLLILGRPIEAWTCFVWGEQRFREVEIEEGSLVDWVHTASLAQQLIAASYLQLPSEIIRLNTELEKIRAPFQKRWYQAVVSSQSSIDPSRLLGETMRRLRGRSLDDDGMSSMWLAVQVLIPGVAGSLEAVRKAASTLDSGPPIEGQPIMTTAVIEAWKVHGADAGLEQWRHFAQLSPHWFHAIWPVQMMFSAWLVEQDGEAALRALGAILDFFEQDLDPLWADELARAAMDEMVFRFYPAAVDLSLGFGASPADAFHFAERGRAFSLRRLLGVPQGGPKTPSSTEERLEREIVASVAAHGSSIEVDELRVQFAAARLERKLLDLSLDFPDFPEPTTVEALQDRVLRQDESLLVYFPGVDRLHVWVIRRDGLWTRHLSWPLTDLEELEQRVDGIRWQGTSSKVCGEARRRWGTPGADCGPAERLTDSERWLHERLIEPAEEFLRPGRLFVVPFGPLHRVPWAALRGSDGRRLVETYEIAQLPSSDALAQIRAHGKPMPAAEGETEALVLGDPISPLSRLEGARREARAVADLFGVEALIGPRAREADILQRASTASMVHLAAHGVYEPGYPLFSRIQLSSGGGEDGFLHVHEIWDRLKLERRPLVALSACDTAAGKPSKGDDIIGLTQAFLVAGSPTVISTLWPVDDVDAGELMTTFYSHFRAGATAGEALQRAQLDMLGSPETELPHSWAGFVLTGDPETRLFTESSAVD